MWPAIIGAVGGLLSGALDSHSQHSANRANIALQREQRAWEEKMSNTEVQRRKADLEAAGFNPMLSFMSGNAASSPSISPARVESTRSGEGVMRGVNSAIAASQLGLLQAQTRKTNAEAAVVESDPGASAQGADLRLQELNRKVQLLGEQIDRTAADTGLSTDTNARAEQMFEYLKEYQRLLNRGEALGLAEKKALNDLYESMKGAKGFERFGPMILSILRGSAR